MLVCGVYCVELFIQVDSSVSLDPSVFPYQDVRNKGVNGGKTGTKPKQRKGRKLATTAFILTKFKLNHSGIWRDWN